MSGMFGAQESGGNSVESYMDKQVYTLDGTYVGVVDEVMLSFEQEEVDALGLVKCNVDLFKNTRNPGNIEVDFEWVRDVDDVILICPIEKEGLAFENHRQQS